MPNHRDVEPPAWEFGFAVLILVGFLALWRWQSAKCTNAGGVFFVRDWKCTAGIKELHP